MFGKNDDGLRLEPVLEWELGIMGMVVLKWDWPAQNLHPLYVWSVVDPSSEIAADSPFPYMHHDIGGRACIYTYSNQIEDVCVGEWLHLQTLVQQFRNVTRTRHHCMDGKWNVSLSGKQTDRDILLMLGTAGGGAVTKNKNRNVVYINQSTTAPQAGCISANTYQLTARSLGDRYLMPKRQSGGWPYPCALLRFTF